MFNKEKSHFQNKMKGVQRTIWDLEFKIFKVRELREEVRKEYDDLNSRLAIVESEVKTQEEKPTKSKEEIEKLKERKGLLEVDSGKLLAQIKTLDLEVNGSKPCKEYPDGVQGIVDQIEALVSLQANLKDYISKL